jgi:hypothetical protein
LVRPACFSGRCPVAGRYTRLNAYGRVRTSDPSKLSTDRTFTGQKSDGAGLLY